MALFDLLLLKFSHNKSKRPKKYNIKDKRYQSKLRSQSENRISNGHARPEDTVEIIKYESNRWDGSNGLGPHEGKTKPNSNTLFAND